MNVEQLRGRMTAIKAEQPGWNCIAFVSGPFLNFFDQDAEVIAETLGVVLCHRNGIPVCSIPGPAIERHAKRLQAAGISVLVDYPPDDAAAPDTQSDEARPISWRDLSADDQAIVIAAMNAAEKNQLRAVALIDRLDAYGLRAEAEALGVSGMAGYMRAHQLDAMEAIIATIEEAGGVPPTESRQ